MAAAAAAAEAAMAAPTPTFRVHDGHVSTQRGGVSVDALTVRARPGLVKRQALLLRQRVAAAAPAAAITATAAVVAAATHGVPCRQRPGGRGQHDRVRSARDCRGLCRTCQTAVLSTERSRCEYIFKAEELSIYYERGRRHRPKFDKRRGFGNLSSTEFAIILPCAVFVI